MFLTFVFFPCNFSGAISEVRVPNIVQDMPHPSRDTITTLHCRYY